MELLTERPVLIKSYQHFKDYQRQLNLEYFGKLHGEVDNFPKSYPCMAYSFKQEIAVDTALVKHIYFYVDDARELLAELRYQI